MDAGNGDDGCWDGLVCNPARVGVGKAIRLLDGVHKRWWCAGAWSIYLASHDFDA